MFPNRTTSPVNRISVSSTCTPPNFSPRAAIAPNDHRVFFGAMDTSALGFAERMIAKAVKAPVGDFRDWDAINAWSEQVSEELD